MEDCRPLRLVLLLQIVAAISVQLPPALGQHQVTDWVYSFCSNATFSTNGSFAHNLNTVLGALAQQASTSLYAQQTAGTSIASSYAYGMYQCRGDLSFSECSACVSTVMGNLVCGPAIGMRVQFIGCYVRYENFNFLQDAEYTLVQSNCSTTQKTTTANSLYQANLAAVLNATAKAAPAHHGFNASSVGNATGSTAYALAQCVGYLSPSQCQSCLSQLSNYTTLCKNSVAGQAYFLTCFYLFDNTPLLFTTASPAPAAPPPNPASPVPQASSTSPSPHQSFGTIGFPKTPSQVQKGKRSTVPIIVGIVLGVFLLLAAAAAAALAGLCFARRRRTTKLAQQSKTTTDAYAALPYKFQQGATKFSLEELREATDNFHPRNKLGEGGFGPVYKV